MQLSLFHSLNIIFYVKRHYKSVMKGTVKNMENVFLRLLVAFDPYISSLKKFDAKNNRSINFVCNDNGTSKSTKIAQLIMKIRLKIILMI